MPCISTYNQIKNRQAYLDVSISRTTRQLEKDKQQWIYDKKGTLGFPTFFCRVIKRLSGGEFFLASSLFCGSERRPWFTLKAGRGVRLATSAGNATKQLAPSHQLPRQVRIKWTGKRYCSFQCQFPYPIRVCIKKNALFQSRCIPHVWVK